jgi:cobalt-zinc-cadmium efflux system outer membrane protein
MGVALVLTFGLATGRAAAQGSDSDVRLPGKDTSLGPSPGASDALGDGANEGVVIRGRPGRGGARVSPSITRPGGQVLRIAGAAAIALPARVEPAEPAPGVLPGLPVLPDDEGPADGLTLDAAIERLVRENLDLRTQFYELPQAQADILTASLRSNPLIYADAVAVPYGSFSPRRPGGQTQYDVSITQPLDLSGKRKARTLVACRARRVLEAQYQDAVRLQIGNLYTAFVDLLAARASVAAAKANLESIDRALAKVGQGTKVDASELRLARAQRRSAEVGVRDAESSVRKANHALAALLNINPAQSELLRVRGSMRDIAVAPPSSDGLVALALQVRPDVNAYRLGVARAEADVHLARVSRYSDVYWAYTPYTFQDNAPFNAKSATSWAMGVTVPVPLLNRNQGNIERARLNVSQTQTGLAALQRRVIAEVQQAAEEYAASRLALDEAERELVPAARAVLDRKTRRYASGEIDLSDYLTAIRESSDIARQELDALVRHRRSMLDLNTAIGQRLLP